MSWLLVLLALYYVVIGFILLIGIRRVPMTSFLTDPFPFVSIMVAARDEEANIRECLESLLDQDYPQRLYEIIVINDRSTDRTGEIIESFARRYPNVIPVHMKNEVLPGLTGKQRALAYSYERCRGEFILNTDADCITPRQWVRQMVSHFASDTGLVIGIPICHRRGERAPLFTRLQSLDLVYLLAYASGATGWDKTRSCIGNNMAYRRAAVDELGGLSSLRDSVTEDAALAQAIECHTDWRTNVALHPEAVVLTKPPETLHAFYRQRKRWLMGVLESRTSEVFLLRLMFLFQSILLISLLSMSVLPALFVPALIALGLKLAIDGGMCYTMCHYLRRRDLLTLLIPYELFLISYTLAVALGTLFTRRVIWKGTQYS